ncbi:hypothetical protein BDZ45DRAFT_750562 [Acephala macrosclerotiorum]|nr:hypothetical protein BDZ45DRAFT_750562 [Acephala macrosclerotiorum]
MAFAPLVLLPGPRLVCSTRTDHHLKPKTLKTMVCLTWTPSQNERLSLTTLRDVGGTSSWSDAEVLDHGLLILTSFSRLRLEFSHSVCSVSIQTHASETISGDVTIAGQAVAVEHLFEQGNILKFIRTSAGVLVQKKGKLVLPKLPSGATIALSFIPMDVWDAFVNEQYHSKVTGLTGSAMTHIFSILGSYDYPEVLALLETGLNGLKQKMHDPSVINIVGKKLWASLTISQKMDQLMNILAVFKYMNVNSVILQVILCRIIEELGDFAAQQVGAENMVKWFNYFANDHISYMDQRINNFVTNKVAEITNEVMAISTNAALFLQAASIGGEAPDILKSSWYTPVQ